MLKTKDFYYDLPEELIAQTPVYPRDSSRLLVYDRKTDTVNHEHFYDLTKYLKKGDLLVINDTKVYPARLYAYTEHGGKVEILLLKRLDLTDWECLVKPGKKAREGVKLTINEELSLTVKSRTPTGERIIEFSFDGVFEDILSRVGEMPLPPYIKEKLEDPERYQTVYSKTPGSAAAPTAGLHFTPELLQQIKDMGVNIAYVTLHVGLGTFRPVKVEDVSEHVMHSEFYMLDEENAAIINNTRKNGGRIFAVGTTATRTLETIAAEDGSVRPCSGWTNIFIYPGYRFKAVDCLVTNFHLPESTLMMLISAFASRDMIMRTYKVAVQEEYRFFSFGDSMLIYTNKEDTHV